MCGIIGIVSHREIANILMDGLRCLEYRGYDSTGIATINTTGQLKCRRMPGKIEALSARLSTTPLSGHIGIAHNRWATHGKPNEQNAHPHCAGTEIAVVHNGIIENYAELRKQLTQQGCIFHSETDTEVLPWLLQQQLKTQPDFRQAVQLLVKQLSGSFAILFLYRSDPTRLIAVRQGSPLIVGLGEGENFLASDPLALLPLTNRFIYLKEGDSVELNCHQVIIYDSEGQIQSRTVHHSTLSPQLTQKTHFQHYMQKEIMEQPQAVQASLSSYLTEPGGVGKLFGLQTQLPLGRIQRVHIIGCGTSYHAGLIARHWLETLAGLPCQVDIASEFRIALTPTTPQTLLIALSQSGETADTLNALRLARLSQKYSALLAICNVAESSLARESDFTLLTHAGPEVGVAATKTFLTQLAVLFLLTLSLGHHSPLSNKTMLAQKLGEIPEVIEQTLALDSPIQSIAMRWAEQNHGLLIARGLSYPVAMEGALKLKELAYIHAEACPAGEMKHGPLALIDHEIPVIVLAPDDAQLKKLESNIQTILARAGKLLVLAGKTLTLTPKPGLDILRLPQVLPELSPFIYTIPLQLLAYYIAIVKGLDVDHPRHLAKSVTVE